MVRKSAQMEAPPRVEDRMGRTFRSVRLSVTPSCNMTCAYCDPAGLLQRGREEFAPVSFYTGIIDRVRRFTPVEEIRLTGGEPTLYPHIVDLIAEFHKSGVGRISLTTNGLSLKKQAGLFAEAGLSDLNVSVDSLDRERFFQMTGSSRLHDVLLGVEEARAAGLSLKTNATILRAKNTADIVPLLEYFGDREIPVRYLELMKMGPIRDSHDDLLVREAEILATIRARWNFHDLPRERSATAHYRITEDGRKFGVIANHSQPFCGDCDRMRIDHKGRIFGCLSSARSFPLPDHDEQIPDTLARALGEKTASFIGSEIHMREIGG